VKDGLGWRKKSWFGGHSLCWSFPFFEGTLTPSLILVAFGLVSCQKKVPEQAAKRDISFSPLWLGKSLTENEPKS
jgi:hypothetical protein